MTRIILDFKFLKYPLCLDPPFGQKGAACNRIVNLHRASALSASRGNGLSGLHLKAICSAADVCVTQCLRPLVYDGTPLKSTGLLSCCQRSLKLWNSLNVRSRQMSCTAPLNAAPPPSSSPPTQEMIVPNSVMDLPPPSPPKPKTIVLPPNWKVARDPEGKIYYYHIVTRLLFPPPL